MIYTTKVKKLGVGNTPFPRTRKSTKGDKGSRGGTGVDAAKSPRPCSGGDPNYGTFGGESWFMMAESTLHPWRLQLLWLEMVPSVVD